MRRLHLPRVVSLPFGVRLAVHQVTPQEMAEHEAIDDASTQGAWIVEERAIYIRRNLPIRVKRNVLWHELQHALVDLKDAAVDEGLARV